MTTERRENLKVYIHTFGCQMNVNDSEHIAGLLTSCGARIVKDPELGDMIIVNTCAVREKSVEKLYSLLGRIESLKKKKGTLIGVVGCVAQIQSSELLERKPYIDFIFGPDNYGKIRDVLTRLTSEKIIAAERSRVWHELPFEHVLRESSVSAYVTIMEGCNNFCSYCIVPFTRGREKSRPMEHVLREISGLARKGYKEIQFLGQNVNTYEDSGTGKGFSKLLRAVENIDGVEWIRFITSHPKNFSEDIAQTMANSKKICHQLHLPLQSGSSSVLKRMNRRYTQEEYLQNIFLLKRLMPDIDLSTDIIVGFPGETEKEFQETLKMMDVIRFTNIFSFRYSPRPLTAASKMKDSVSFDVKRRRLMEVQVLQKKLQLEMNRSLIGKKMKVLCTGRSKKDMNTYSGRNEGHQVVNFSSEHDVTRRFVDVRIVSCGPYSLRGEILSPS